jgi:hypothetical protein
MNNPYAPPKSDVADVAKSHQDAAELPFFPVSVTKLVVLSICTLTFYQYYWIYKNWKSIRARTGERLSPALRTLFPIFFCYQLFVRVREHEAANDQSTLPAGLLAIGWIGFSLLWKLSEPYYLVALLALPCLIPVQTEINRINAVVAPNHNANDRFSGWNWVAVVLGGPFFALTIYGSFLPPQ